MAVLYRPVAASGKKNSVLFDLHCARYDSMTLKMSARPCRWRLGPEPATNVGTGNFEISVPLRVLGLSPTYRRNVFVEISACFEGTVCAPPRGFTGPTRQPAWSRTSLAKLRSCLSFGGPCAWSESRMFRKGAGQANNGNWWPRFDSSGLLAKLFQSVTTFPSSCSSGLKCHRLSLQATGCKRLLKPFKSSYVRQLPQRKQPDTLNNYWPSLRKI